MTDPFASVTFPTPNGITPVGTSPVMVGVAIQQAQSGAQLCALGHHAWVPWLDTGASWHTWCAREGCDHKEQWDR